MTFVKIAVGILLADLGFRWLNEVVNSRYYSKAARSIRTDSGWLGWVVQKETNIFRRMRPYIEAKVNDGDEEYQYHTFLRWTGHGWQERIGFLRKSDGLVLFLEAEDATLKARLGIDDGLQTEWAAATTFVHFGVCKNLEKIIPRLS